MENQNCEVRQGLRAETVHTLTATLLPVFVSVADTTCPKEPCHNIGKREREGKPTHARVKRTPIGPCQETPRRDNECPACPQLSQRNRTRSCGSKGLGRSNNLMKVRANRTRQPSSQLAPLPFAAASPSSCGSTPDMQAIHIPRSTIQQQRNSSVGTYSVDFLVRRQQVNGQLPHRALRWITEFPADVRTIQRGQDKRTTGNTLTEGQRSAWQVTDQSPRKS